MVIQQICISFSESVSSKRTRSPSSARSNRGKENKTMETSRNKSTSEKLTGYHSSSKTSPRFNVHSVIETNLGGVIFRSPSPSKYDLPSSPPCKMRSNLKHVLLYDNVKEDRVLQHQLRKLDAEQHRGVVSIATDIARVRETSANIRRGVTHTPRVNSADFVATTNPNLPPIFANANSSLTYPHQPRQNVNSPSDVRRQRMSKLKPHSMLPELSLPKIHTPENGAKSGRASRQDTDKTRVSLPDVCPNQSNVTTRKFMADIKMPKGTSEIQSDALSLERCLKDDRFIRLRESLLSMSTVHDIEDLLNDTAEHGSTTERSNKNHDTHNDGDYGDNDERNSHFSWHPSTSVTDRTD